MKFYVFYVLAHTFPHPQFSFLQPHTKARRLLSSSHVFCVQSKMIKLSIFIYFRLALLSSGSKNLFFIFSLHTRMMKLYRVCRFIIPRRPDARQTEKGVRHMEEICKMYKVSNCRERRASGQKYEWSSCVPCVVSLAQKKNEVKKKKKSEEKLFTGIFPPLQLCMFVSLFSAHFSDRLYITTGHSYWFTTLFCSFSNFFFCFRTISTFAFPLSIPFSTFFSTFMWKVKHGKIFHDDKTLTDRNIKKIKKIKIKEI